MSNFATPVLLSVRKLTKRFGGLVAVNEISFDLHSGETLGIIGPNGAGKSTVFSLLTGFLPADGGEVSFGGASVLGLRPDQICQLGLARTFQIMQNFPALTTLENVMVGSFLRHKKARQAQEKAKEILDKVGLGAKAKVAAGDLTLLDQKRLEIAKVLATNPEVVLADETMAGLTPVEINEAVDLLLALRADGVTFILIEHVMQVIMSLSDRILVLHHGDKICEGTPTEVANDKRVIDAYLGEEEVYAGS
jgi:branched-chain amino acid transport system ATP-binding protein